MGRVLGLVAACAVAAHGGFGQIASLVGLTAYGDYLAALVMLWLVALLLAAPGRQPGGRSAARGR